MPVTDAETAHPCRTPEQLAAILADLERDGVAVVRRILDEERRGRLLAEVEAVLGAQSRPGGTACDLAFIERSPTLQEILLDPRFLGVVRAVIGAQDLVVNRSAAILRCPGSPQVRWHSDFDFGSGRPVTVDAVLNRGTWPGGLWFYLTGCHPGHGGLAVIRGSHGEDWRPPEPWRLSDDRRSLLQGDGALAAMVVPGLVPVLAEPGDLVVFAARTFHAAYAMDPDHRRPRLSCGLGLRPRSRAVLAPWPLPEATADFCRRLPEPLAPFFDGYTGIVPGWRGD